MHEDTFVQRVIFAQNTFIRGTFLHEDTFAQKVTFAHKVNFEWEWKIIPIKKKLTKGKGNSDSKSVNNN